MSKIFLTSDLHLGHDREFMYKPRGFTSIEEHDEAIFKRWNSVVSDNDIVYILGDLMLGDNEQGIRKLEELCGTFNVVIGNHDTDTRVELFKNCPKIKSILYADFLKYKGYRFFLCHYPTLTANLEKEYLKQCTINLFGHTHQKTNFYNDIPFMYHVGMDSHDCYPVLLNDIIEDCKNKVKECKEFL